MKLVILFFAAVASVSLAQTNYIFEATIATDEMRKAISTTAAVSMDARCVAVGTQPGRPDIVGTNEWRYRIAVTKPEYDAGWLALSQAKKDAAKAAAQDARANIAKWDDRHRAAIRALVKTINLRLPAAQRITAEELKAAIKEEL